MKRLLFWTLFLPISLVMLFFGMLGGMLDWVNDRLYDLSTKYENWSFDINSK
jgi:hypothetical protein